MRDPTLRAEGTEYLQASACTLLLPEVSGRRGSFLVCLPPLPLPRTCEHGQARLSYEGDLSESV